SRPSADSTWLALLVNPLFTLCAIQWLIIFVAGCSLCLPAVPLPMPAADRAQPRRCTHGNGRPGRDGVRSGTCHPAAALAAHEPNVSRLMTCWDAIVCL